VSIIKGSEEVRKEGYEPAASFRTEGQTIHIQARTGPAEPQEFEDLRISR
jgi:hypothetical protein